jgi:hypothetical protein
MAEVLAAVQYVPAVAAAARTPKVAANQLADGAGGGEEPPPTDGQLWPRGQGASA